jgi:hypothetical protein
LCPRSVCQATDSTRRFGYGRLRKEIKSKEEDKRLMKTRMQIEGSDVKENAKNCTPRNSVGFDAIAMESGVRDKNRTD